MSANRYLLPILVILSIVGSYAAAKTNGNWSVSGKQTINTDNLSSSENVRGWMTLEQLSVGYGIEQNELYKLLGIPAEISPETALKDLEGMIPNFEVSSVRESLAIFLGEVLEETDIQPFSTELPEEEVVFQETPIPTEHIPQGAGSGDGLGPTPLPPGQLLADSEIKGRQTLQEIIDGCQVNQADLLTALELPENTDLNTMIKDLIGIGKVTEIQSVRDAVATLQSK
jgi:hypothetical protein